MSADQIGVFAESLLYSQHPDGQKHEVDINTFITEQLDFLKPQARFRGVQLDSNLEPKSPVILSEPSALQQVIFCLTTNAAESMLSVQSDSPTIIVTTCVDAQDGMLEVHVLDNGPGIDPALFGRLFNERVSTKATGHGYGLLSAARVIADLGGSLVAGNHPEGGAEFVVRLPLRVGSTSELFVK